MGRPCALSPAHVSSPLWGPCFGDLVEWQMLLQGTAVEFSVSWLPGIAVTRPRHRTEQRVPLLEVSQGLPLAARPLAESSCCPWPGHGCSTQTKHSVRTFWGRVVLFWRRQGLRALPAVLARVTGSERCVIPWAWDVCYDRSWRLNLIQ